MPRQLALRRCQWQLIPSTCPPARHGEPSGWLRTSKAPNKKPPADRVVYGKPQAAYPDPPCRPTISVTAAASAPRRRATTPTFRARVPPSHKPAALTRHGTT
ncbi:hypothetical protein PLESTF_001183200 [Pleodorina starrii]|nr:hypothetical protein PLESTF_001183200 [Pleodorina starrii]